MILIYPKAESGFKSEDQLQAAAYQWAYNQFPATRRLLWAVPNGGHRNKLEAVKLKATGVTAGVHDMHLFINSKFTTFEAKISPNVMSKDQETWASLVDANGGDCVVYYTLQQFQDAFQMALASAAL